VIIDMIVVNLE